MCTAVITVQCLIQWLYSAVDLQEGSLAVQSSDTRKEETVDESATWQISLATHTTAPTSLQYNTVNCTTRYSTELQYTHMHYSTINCTNVHCKVVTFTALNWILLNSLQCTELQHMQLYFKKFLWTKLNSTVLYGTQLLFSKVQGSVLHSVTCYCTLLYSIIMYFTIVY